MKAEEAKAETEQTKTEQTEGEEVKAEEVEQPKGEEPKEEQQTEEPKEEEQLPTEDPKTEEQVPTEEASKQTEQGEVSEGQGTPVGKSNQGSEQGEEVNNPNTTQAEESKKDFSTKKKKQKVNTTESLSKDSGLHIGKGNGKSVVNPNDFLPNKKEMKESSGAKRLGGVYYKNGIAYVSNGRRMVAIRCNYPEEYEGKTIKDGEIVEGEYPMIQDGIFPKDGILFNSPISVVEEVSRIPNNIESVVLNGIPYTHRDISEIAKVAGKTKNTITSWIKSKARGKSFQLELPQYTQLLIRRVMGKDYDSHNIAINGIKHGLNNHGANGRKLTKGSIPIREEDTALIPYIITAPDYVRKGSTDIDGRESIKFYKNLSNGYVVVVEKEYKNSPDDMETINIWAEMSDKAIDAQRNAAPGINVQNAILDIDVAKILKGVEYTIRCRNCNKEDHKIREQRTGQLVCGDLGLDYGIVWMLSMR